MDAILDKLNVVINGETEEAIEQALKDLGMLEITLPQIHVRNKENTTKDHIKKAFLIATHARVAANLLGIISVEEGSEFLMGVVFHVGEQVFKKHLRCEVEVPRVIKYIRTITNNRKEWFQKNGELKAAAATEEFCEIIEEAAKGDQKCMHLLELDKNLNFSFDVFKKFPTAQRLGLYYKSAKDLCVVGIKMEDELLQKINLGILEYLEWFQVQGYPKKPELCSKTFEPHLVCTTLHDEVKDRSVFLQFVEEKNRQRRIQVSEEACSDLEDQLKDPNYVPGTPSASENEEEEVEGSPGKKRIKRKMIHPVSPIKTKKAKEDNLEIATENKKKTKTKAENLGKEKKRSHHRKEECPVCHKEIFDLLRHLRKHAEKGAISQEDVPKMASVAKKKHRRRAAHRGQRPGLKYKWCPYEGCQVVTHLLRSHLQHKHRVRSGELLNTYVRVAREYRGKIEAESLQIYEETETPQRSATPSNVTDASSTKTMEEHERPSTSTLSEENREEDDDTEVEYTHQEDYFTSESPTTDRHRWLIAFYNHLNLPDAGRKKARNRLQHAAHIKTILEDLDPHGADLEVLSRDEGYIVWTDWVDLKMNILKTGTINAYLGTYEKFLTFVGEERVRSSLPEPSDDTKRVFRNVIPKLKGWRRTVDIDLRPQRTQRILDECDNRLTNQDVENFYQSKQVREAKVILESATESQFLSERQLTDARDYLIMLITLKTGTRPGALENCRMCDYQSMRKDPKRGHYVILVPNHKRQMDGPAMLSLNNSLKDMLDVYVAEVRTKFPAPQDEQLFLQSNGNAFKGGKIAKRLPEFWQKSGVRPDLRVTATNIRKWIVTTCHQKKCNGASFDESVIRRAMCHSDRAAKANYLREDLTEVSAAALDIIAACTSTETSNPNPVNRDHVSPSSTGAESSKVRPLTSDFDHVSPSSPEVESSKVRYLTSDLDHVSPSSPEAKSSNVRPLTSEEKTLIKTIFNDIIVKDQVVCVRDIRPLMMTDPKLRTLVPRKTMVQRVADHIRYCQVKHPRKDPNELPQADTESNISEWLEASVGSMTGGKSEWGQEDNELMEKYFGSRQKPPKKAELMEMLHKTEELKELLTRKTFQQCKDKIKNMLRKKKKKAC